MNKLNSSEKTKKFTIKMTKQEREEWNNLYQYIKTEILGYTTQILPRYFVIRLKGLHEGKFISNKNTRSLGEYSYKEILLTVKLCKSRIINAYKNKTFSDEQHKINYFMVVIENNINDIVTRLKNVKKQEDKVKEVNIEIDKPKSNYKRRTKDVKNSRLEGML